MNLMDTAQLLGNFGVSLDAIDYDESGNLSMSGQAPESARVRVYLDNRPIGGATTGEAGQLVGSHIFIVSA